MTISQTAPEFTVYGRAKLPTRHGVFDVVSFAGAGGQGIDDVALVFGDIDGASDVPVRVHSECLTGDVFGSVRCDCRDQLELALARIVEEGRGVVLYLRQEGRGIGIAEKVRAYHLQDAGLDTVDANLKLGFADDLRTYERAGSMLAALRVESVVVHTNNPKKVEGLAAAGVSVRRRQPLRAPARPENAAYVRTKITKSGHHDDE